MKNIIFAFLFLTVVNSVAHAETLPDFICPRMTLGAPTSDQSKIVGLTVAIFLTGRDQRPMTSIVKGLDLVYPPGTQLQMYFQNILGLGKPNDGEIIHAEANKGDRMLQDLCGVEANILIFDRKKNQYYCGSCVSP